MRTAPAEAGIRTRRPCGGRQASQNAFIFQHCNVETSQPRSRKGHSLFSFLLLGIGNKLRAQARLPRHLSLGRCVFDQFRSAGPRCCKDRRVDRRAKAEIVAPTETFPPPGMLSIPYRDPIIQIWACGKPPNCLHHQVWAGSNKPIPDRTPYSPQSGGHPGSARPLKPGSLAACASRACRRQPAGSRRRSPADSCPAGPPSAHRRRAASSSCGAPSPRAPSSTTARRTRPSSARAAPRVPTQRGCQGPPKCRTFSKVPHELCITSCELEDTLKNALPVSPLKVTADGNHRCT